MDCGESCADVTHMRKAPKLHPVTNMNATIFIAIIEDKDGGIVI